MALIRCNENHPKKLEYQFDSKTQFDFIYRLSLDLTINKFVFSSKDSTKTIDSLANSIKTLNGSSPLTELTKKLRERAIRTLKLETVANKTILIQANSPDSAQLEIKSNIQKATLKANDSIYPAGQYFIDLLTLMQEETSNRAISKNGEWLDSPKIMGMDLATLKKDVFFNQLLTYLQKAPSFPDEKTKNGDSWSKPLHINIPVDSMSKGQSKGFIDIIIENQMNWESTKNNIANIKNNLIVKINWEVIIPNQGYSKFNFSFSGSGYRFFNFKNGWDYGLFMKGDFTITVDAETIDKKDNNAKVPTNIDISGKIELAEKYKE